MKNWEKWLSLGNAAALFLILVGLLAAGAVGFLGRRGHREADNRPEARNASSEERLILDDPRVLTGTRWLLSALRSDSERSFAKYSKARRVRNYLLFDSESKATRWLWPTNAQTLFGEATVHDGQAGQTARSAKGLAIIVEKDLAEDDRKARSLQYFDFRSARLIEVAASVERLIGVEKTREDEATVFYSRDGRMFFRAIRLSDAALSEEKEIPLPGA